MPAFIIKYQTICTISLYLLLISFVAFYFTDGISKTIFRTSSDFHRYGSIVKGSFEFFVLGYSILTLRRQKLEFLVAIVILISIFLVGQFFLYRNFNEINFLENFNTLFKYLFPLIIYLLAIDILELPTEKKNKIFKYYRYILSFNGLLILYGILFGSRILQTYDSTYRYGFDGLIFAQNEASYIFILAVFTVYYRRFYLKIKEWFFWIIIITSLAVATKAVYLTFILLLLYHVFTRVPLKKVLIYGLTGILTFYLVFNTIVNKIFVNSYNVFMHGYRREGLLFALTSGRNEFIEQKLEPLILNIWTIPNFLFGGQDVSKFYMEMGFLDLFLFFGLLGSIIYCYIFFKLFQKIDFDLNSKIFLFFVIVTIIATAGHFFTSGIVGMHFIFFMIINRRSQKTYLDENISIK
jgi:hypothetical protein